MGLSGGRGTPNLTTMNTPTQINPSELHATIKLGIDARAKWFYVGRQLDGATRQRVQKMTFDGQELLSLEGGGLEPRGPHE